VVNRQQADAVTHLVAVYRGTEFKTRYCTGNMIMQP